MRLKKRLDILLVERGLAPTRTKAQALIMSGAVRAGAYVIDKPGTRVDVDCPLEVLQPPCPYVSRGGLKLQKALEHFSIDVEGKCCIDVGASTGGFTHCLLFHGARQVVAIDVGYGQLDWSLRNDPRVVVLERTNFRRLDTDTFPYKDAQIITIDVSFISLKLILPVARKILAGNSHIVALIKPQFEVGPENVGKGGVVKDSGLHQKVIDDILTFCNNSLKLKVTGVVESPIKGAKGNREFLMAAKTP